MPDRELGVRLTAKELISKALDKVARSTRSAKDKLGELPSVASRVSKALGDMAYRGVTALGQLAEKAFFVREALRTVAEVAMRAFDAFVRPAVTLRKVTVALTNMTGSADMARQMLAQVQQVALDTGASFQQMSSALPDVVSMLRDAQGNLDPAQWDAYLTALKRIIAFRPDLSATEQMAIVNQMMAGNVETAAEALGRTQQEIEQALGVGEGSEKQLGRYTSILRGAESVERTATDVVKALDSLGVTEEIIDRNASALDRLRERWEAFKLAIGEKILDRVVDALIRLMDWLEANEPAVVELADKIANYLVDAVIALLDWLTPERLDKITSSIGNMVDMVAKLVMAFASMPGWAQKALLGGALALGPLGGGKALLGAAGKGIGALGKGLGGLFGGGAAAGGAAAAGGISATAGTVAAGGLAAAGGFGLGLGANELISRTDWGKRMGVQPTRNVLAVGAYGAGKALGGQDLGEKWFSKLAGIKAQPQQVEVTVSVDDSGALRAYTRNEISTNNRDIVGGWMGGGASAGRKPVYGGWGR